MEVRYIGTRNREQWTSYNYNELNILENGFLDEFKRAQNNLYANIAAGRGETFAHFGPGAGTSPLPIYLAYLRGTSVSLGGNCDSLAACQAMYAGNDWSRVRPELREAGITHVVIPADRAPRDTAALERVYQDGTYHVYRVRGQG